MSSKSIGSTDWGRDSPQNPSKRIRGFPKAIIFVILAEGSDLGLRAGDLPRVPRGFAGGDLGLHAGDCPPGLEGLGEVTSRPDLPFG